MLAFTGIQTLIKTMAPNKRLPWDRFLRLRDLRERRVKQKKCTIKITVFQALTTQNTYVVIDKRCHTNLKIFEHPSPTVVGTRRSCNAHTSVTTRHFLIFKSLRILEKYYAIMGPFYYSCISSAQMHKLLVFSQRAQGLFFRDWASYLNIATPPNTTGMHQDSRASIHWDLNN